MSTNRERQRARRRQEKRAARQDSRKARIRRNQQVVAAMVAVLLLIGGAVALSRRLGDDAAAGGSTSPSSRCTTTKPAPGQPPSKRFPCPRPGLAQNSIWTAKMATSAGDLELRLDGTKAPQTVASFISLSRNTFYDNTACHRLTTQGIFVLQCGDPTGTGGGGPGYEYGIENAPKAGPDQTGDYPAGTLAMARRDDPNSNGSQFFMVHQDSVLPASTGGYTVFGRVTVGLDVLEAIARKGTSNGKPDGPPKQPVTIKSITVEKQ